MYITVLYIYILPRDGRKQKTVKSPYTPLSTQNKTVTPHRSTHAYIPTSLQANE